MFKQVLRYYYYCFFKLSCLKPVNVFTGKFVVGTDKFNIYGGYSFRRWSNLGNSTIIRETYTDNQRLEQQRNSERNNLEHTINMGADYYLGKNKISYKGALNLVKESDTENNVHVFNMLSNEQLFNYTRLNT